MDRFILDTSLFVNPASRKQFGKTPPEAVRAFVRKAKAKKGKAEFYMPPLVMDELANFAKKDAGKLSAVVKKRAPNIYGIYIPAAILYSFIEDVRARVNKGLRLAEEFAQDNRPENAEKLSKLRAKYRDAMRKGMVDSREDLEIILLAYELGAAIVTSDEGITLMANQIGVEWIEAEKFGELLKAL
ncbi:RNA ligase partner protein [Candidatus Micrarchaeota archaeon]|nr:RNA ligase partner protein [Candidatus Micrarchaeota archaeon]